MWLRGSDVRAMSRYGLSFGVFHAVVGRLAVAIIIGKAPQPSLVPLTGGFALIGPFAAVGRYDLSRRREGAWR